MGGSSYIEADKRVGARNMARRLFLSQNDTCVLRVRENYLTPITIDAAIYYARFVVGNPYSLLDAIRLEQGVTDRSSDDTQICTRLVAKAYAFARVNIVDNVEMCTPQQLLESKYISVHRDLLRVANDFDIRFAESYDVIDDMVKECRLLFENNKQIKEHWQNKYFISSQFYADYIKAGLYDERLYEEDSPTLDGIIDEIVNTFYNINEKSKSHYGKFMFDPSNDTTRLLYQDLRKKCDSRDKVPNFINSIYLLYWEGAKERGIAGYKLPEFFKKTVFRKAMDRLRHVFGKAHQQDKLDTCYDQIDKPSALKVITGDSIEPQSPSDWLFFQERMLDLFLQELKTLYDAYEKNMI